MTDPATNVDMEGVLSSVRKLVSEGEGERAQTGNTAAAETSGTATVGSDTGDPDATPPRDGGRPAKLVLTPAQRVTEGGTVPAGAPDRPADSDPGTSDRAAAPLVLERPIRPVARGSGDAGPAPDAGGTDAATPGVSRGADQQTEHPGGAALGDTMAADLPADTVATAPATKSPLTDATAPEAGAGSDVAEDAGTARHPSGPEALDEAALRALVAEIVREELQGALGDRITRNVRKLVRQEVYRHLSSRDLD